MLKLNGIQEYEAMVVNDIEDPTETGEQKRKSVENDESVTRRKIKWQSELWQRKKASKRV